MSFMQHGARLFSETSIRNNAPETSGVYGISNAAEWIFIGETSNIQASLMEHLEETNTRLANRKPTGFTYEKCSPAERIQRQDALVRQYEPFCNRRMAPTSR